MALRIRHQIEQSKPLEGEDARRFVDDVENPDRSDERLGFLKESEGTFSKHYSPKSANDLFDE